MEDNIINPSWSKVSTQLISDPDNLQLWEDLIKASESNNKHGITKSTPIEELTLLRVTYEKLLEKYPLLVNYWIKYADWEFKLGHTDKSIHIYQTSLQYLSSSIELWISYLQFRIITIKDDIDEVLKVFEVARREIGYHFHGAEFYKLYLNFLQSYSTETNQFDQKYYTLLRIILEIPLYHYEYFFKLFFDIIASIQTEKEPSKIISYLVSEKDSKAVKITDNKSASSQLKKIFIDVYITTQYKVYELYYFEKQLIKPYFDLSPISIQQLQIWDKYLDFLELRDYPSSYIEFVYNRCLLSSATLYAQIWIKFTDYYILRKDYDQAETILMRGVRHCEDYTLFLKLVDLTLFNEEIIRARDLILGYIKNSIHVPFPIYEKLINIERLLNHKDDEYLINIFREIIKKTNNDWFFHHLLNYTVSHELKLKLFLEFESTFKKSAPYKQALQKLNKYSLNIEEEEEKEKEEEETTRGSSSYDDEIESFL